MLNKHESENSTTLDPTVDESPRVDPFQEARDRAIEIVQKLYWDSLPRSTHPYWMAGVIDDAFRAGVEAAAALPRVHRIGVFDYDSLVECLKSNFERAFPGEPFRDPQDAIQQLAAVVMEGRRVIAGMQTIIHQLEKENA